MMNLSYHSKINFLPHICLGSALSNHIWQQTMWKIVPWSGICQMHLRFANGKFFSFHFQHTQTSRTKLFFFMNDTACHLTICQLCTVNFGIRFYIKNYIDSLQFQLMVKYQCKLVYHKSKSN